MGKHETNTTPVCKLYSKDSERKTSPSTKISVSTDFFGHVFSDKGISADPEKIIAIENLSAPQNVSELRSLLRMTTYCSRFIQDYATTTQPLRELIRKDHTWKWGPEQHQHWTS